MKFGGSEAMWAGLGCVRTGERPAQGREWVTQRQDSTPPAGLLALGRELKERCPSVSVTLTSQMEPWRCSPWL